MVNNKNAILNPSESAKNPHKGGITAPPTIIVHKIPEA